MIQSGELDFGFEDEYNDYDSDDQNIDDDYDEPDNDDDDLADLVVLDEEDLN